jgi:hypothetical protein
MAPAPLAVLLVEDHPVNQQFAVSLLEKWGHRVTLAANGREALDELARNRFDLVFMDVQMPVMDGLEATHQFRRTERGRRTTIIAMTANAMQGDRDICLAAGMDDYIAKPIRQPICWPCWRATFPSAAAENFDYAQALAAADEEVLEIISATFVAQFPKDIAALRTAIAARDFAPMQRVAHSLKGTCALFDALPMIELSRELEGIDPTTPWWQTAPRLVAGLETEFARLTPALGAFIG